MLVRAYLHRNIYIPALGDMTCLHMSTEMLCYVNTMLRKTVVCVWPVISCSRVFSYNNIVLLRVLFQFHVHYNTQCKRHDTVWGNHSEHSHEIQGKQLDFLLENVPYSIRGFLWASSHKVLGNKSCQHWPCQYHKLQLAVVAQWFTRILIRSSGWADKSNTRGDHWH